MKLILFIFLLTPFYGYSGDCFYRPQTLQEVIEQNKDKGKTYFRATIIEQVKLKDRYPYYQAFDIKIHEYWSKVPLEMASDTLRILGNVCGMTLHPGSEYLLVLEYTDGFYCDREWSGTDVFPKYKDEIFLLGPPLTISSVEKTTAIKDTTTLSNSAGETKNQYLLWLAGIVLIAAVFFLAGKRNKTDAV